MKIELTKSECENVAEYIEISLLDTIRQDTSIDNFAWLESLVTAVSKLKKAAENGGTDHD